MSVRLGRALPKDVFLQQLNYVDSHINSQWKHICIEGSTCAVKVLT